MCAEFFCIVSIFSSFVFRSNGRPKYLALFFQLWLGSSSISAKIEINKMRKKKKRGKQKFLQLLVFVPFTGIFWITCMFGFYMLIRTEVCTFYKRKIVSIADVQNCTKIGRLNWGLGISERRVEVWGDLSSVSIWCERCYVLLSWDITTVLWLENWFCVSILIEISIY